MDRFLHLNFAELWCKRGSRILAFSWFFGLICGVLVSSHAGESFISAMRAAENSCVSIIGLLFAILLPFLFSAFAVFLSRPWLLIPVVFGKAFIFSLLATGISLSFGEAGWLFLVLLLFSDGAALPFLWLFWLRYCRLHGRFPFIGLAVCAVPALIIGYIDLNVISPFLASLISY